MIRCEICDCPDCPSSRRCKRAVGFMKACKMCGCTGYREAQTPENQYTEDAVKFNPDDSVLAVIDHIRSGVEEITSEVKNMASGKSKKSSSKSGEKQSPFLKPEHLNQKGTTPMTVKSVGYIGDSGYGLKMNFNVTVKGKPFTFGIKPTNLSIKKVINNAINGKTVDLEAGDYDGNPYVKVTED